MSPMSMQATIRSALRGTLIILGSILVATSPAQAYQPALVGAPSVSIASFLFQPDTLSIQFGQTVTWTNTDSAFHTVTASGGEFGSGTLSQSSTFQHQFLTPGTFSYYCSFHAGMQGSITVAAAPYTLFLPQVIAN